MSQIIIPGDTRDEFAYGKLIGGESKIPTAMVKFPKTMMDRIGTSDEETTRMILLASPKDDADGEFEVTCYEFYNVSFPTGSLEKPDDVLELDKEKDGYVYLPKQLRDGRHERFYFVAPIEEAEFTPKVERGMFEEVAWSPFGTVAEAAKQEAVNTDRNPLLRRWERV